MKTRYACFAILEDGKLTSSGNALYVDFPALVDTEVKAKKIAEEFSRYTTNPKKFQAVPVVVTVRTKNLWDKLLSYVRTNSN